MSRLFFDTSSLVKLYHAEPDSVQLRQQVRPNDELIVSNLTKVEMHAAFGRKIRRGELTQQAADAELLLFQRDWPEFTPIDLDAACLDATAKLVQRHHGLALRSLDAIQLAAALVVGPLNAFFTHDERLRQAALAEGPPVR